MNEHPESNVRDDKSENNKSQSRNKFTPVKTTDNSVA